jgi:hypothetical protein
MDPAELNGSCAILPEIHSGSVDLPNSQTLYLPVA